MEEIYSSKTRMTMLDSVIQLKEWHREELETEIHRIQQVINTHEEQLKNLESDFKKHIEQFKRDHQSGLSPDSLQSFHSYLASMDGRMRKEREAILRRLNELKGKREKLIALYREQMAVEKLKDRYVDEAKRLSARQEQKELDFISIQRFVK